MSGLRVFHPKQVPAPIGFGYMQVPLRMAIYYTHVFGFDQLVVLILCKIAELAAGLIPPPAPLYFIKFQLYCPRTFKRVSFGVNIGNVNGIVLVGVKHARKLAALGCFYAHIARIYIIRHAHRLYAKVPARLKNFDQEVCRKLSRGLLIHIDIGVYGRLAIFIEPAVKNGRRLRIKGKGRVVKIIIRVVLERSFPGRKKCIHLCLQVLCRSAKQPLRS